MRMVYPTRPLTFQSTHLHEVRLQASPAASSSQRSFNPRTYTRCDTRRTGVLHIRGVSIHAPTRGATLTSIADIDRGNVSIHAPTRGATFRAFFSSIFGRSFNPRTYTRCDNVQNTTVQAELEFQSTHLHEVRLNFEVNKIVVE